MSFSVSTLGAQSLATVNLQNEQTQLQQLNEELASGNKYQNLTQYAPIDAHNIMDIQNTVTQRQAYIQGMQTVSSRLSMYDTTMTDIESIAQQASTLASSNQTYDSTKVAQIQAQSQSYLQQVQSDLNQQVNGRYVYAGVNYTTPPVANLTTLGVPALPFTATSSPALPDYSSENVPANSFTINSTPTGSFQIGNTSIKWSDLAAGSVTNVYVSGTATPVTVTGLSPASTPAQLATNLITAINQLSGSVSDFSGFSATSTGGQVNLTTTASLTQVVPDKSGTGGETTWANNKDGSLSEPMALTDAGAYTQDTVAVDNGYNLQYGVTSNAPGFQEVIAGLRLMNAASAQTDPAVYQNYMTQAATLLSKGLQDVQSTHAGVAGNINLVTQETALQNTDITNLQTQLGNIQQVDMTTVGTQINLLQTQLQASYSATASLIQESILKYL